MSSGSESDVMITAVVSSVQQAKYVGYNQGIVIQACLSKVVKFLSFSECCYMQHRTKCNDFLPECVKVMDKTKSPVKYI